MTVLGNRIRMLRAEKGLSIDELGKLSGVSLEVLSTIEKGEPLSLTSGALLDIAKALETDPEKLAGNTVAAATLGERIRQARESAGLSQSALSRLAGISGPAMVELENGLNTKPTASIVTALARALGVTRDWILLGTGTPPPPAPEKNPATELEHVIAALDKNNKAILLGIAQTLLAYQKPPEKEQNLERIKGILLAEGIVLDLS